MVKAKSKGGLYVCERAESGHNWGKSVHSGQSVEWAVVGTRGWSQCTVGGVLSSRRSYVVDKVLEWWPTQLAEGEDMSKGRDVSWPLESLHIT